MNRRRGRNRGSLSGHSVRRRLVAYWPLLLVLVIVAAAMEQVLTEHWRVGSALLGIATLTAAGLRIVLPPDRAGLLAIRGRMADVLLYGGFGVVVLLLALTITRGSLAVG